MRRFEEIETMNWVGFSPEKLGECIEISKGEKHILPAGQAVLVSHSGGVEQIIIANKDTVMCGPTKVWPIIGGVSDADRDSVKKFITTRESRFDGPFDFSAFFTGFVGCLLTLIWVVILDHFGPTVIPKAVGAIVLVVLLLGPFISHLLLWQVRTKRPERHLPAGMFYKAPTDAAPDSDVDMTPYAVLPRIPAS